MELPAADSEATDQESTKRNLFRTSSDDSAGEFSTSSDANESPVGTFETSEDEIETSAEGSNFQTSSSDGNDDHDKPPKRTHPVTRNAHLPTAPPISTSTSQSAPEGYEGTRHYKYKGANDGEGKDIATVFDSVWRKSDSSIMGQGNNVTVKTREGKLEATIIKVYKEKTGKKFNKAFVAMPPLVRPIFCCWNAEWFQCCFTMLFHNSFAAA